ncbi:hypothetical protein A2291_01700 [candidate division WOR-1 bacterium RIFOXYB2_FULL_42_35]|uniref:Diacylglycerol kinase n=1 Tax=candidate division WOR-1 bacterium RIFOXYC2_FULL_41_25 TaxID=1802586 RepID=A0A1F4TQC2_UNCSA|nr:MAG: hypothetical protein A2247_03500 [candidate division WOR-1 bacterium RIFOXYA2_FULL_41_14]OGC25460.1 MAG: hypothetical protein A2291_01700 [candidate division WOR-1 bacterium RIFOXYB2_FULL_42_35]OGC34866.1 MAG: hypothetical protein A2462_05635 [candidate division WOR-1 bacterium RIFOXYC2_FULL_41_25]OGC42308.1 MAG: hypothetical protein A2548_04130 [candidate division WOR-1 bacterium RIFOXYD2_FULL_41_8]
MPRKFIKSFECAKSGVGHAVKTQRNLWIHFFAGLAVLFVATQLQVSLLELAVLVTAIFAVIVIEMVNTSIEELVNILSPEHRKEAALAKDVAAASVLLSAVGAVVVGLLILVPKIL